MKTCPSCQMLSPDSAERCDCGRSFGPGHFDAALNYSHEIAKDIRIIRNVAVFWAVMTVVGGVFGALYWMGNVDRYERALKAIQQSGSTERPSK